MTPLENTIYNWFYSFYSIEKFNTCLPKYTNVNFFEILTDEYFELPVFISELFRKEVGKGKIPQKLVPILYSYKNASYRTFNNAIIRETTRLSFNLHKLIKFISNEQDTCIPYYITRGAIFDKDFNCIFLCSWEIKVINEEGLLVKTIKPVCRIHPNCFYKKDNVQKFIINKLFPTIRDLSLNITYNITQQQIDSIVDNLRVKIIIDDIPFNIKHPVCPNVTTTASDLLQAAITQE